MGKKDPDIFVWNYLGAFLHKCLFLFLLYEQRPNSYMLSVIRFSIFQQVPEEFLKLSKIFLFQPKCN